ncbi:MAG TPA: HEAT repeat domain-containing protein [Polyangiaceae bacterium]|nr:HEAT repeat domain-containing protein [Polyangiaceae bacterium]
MNRRSSPVRPAGPVRLVTLGASSALVAFLAVLAPNAEAAGKSGSEKAKDKTEKQAPAVDSALEKRLAGDEDDAIAALQEIGDSGNVSAAPLVGALLQRGSSQKVLEEALKTAGKLKAESLSPAVAPYVQHRAPDLRHAAVRALLKTKGVAAVDALRVALRSSDAMVRGTAATGLGALGAREAIQDLFKAFDHGVGEAGAAIGQLCKPEECEQFAERTGKVPFDVMVTGFDQVLFRPPADIPDEAKIRLVGRMRELGTGEVGKYLADVADRWPKEWSKKVKQAIDNAAHAVGGGKK